MDEVALGQDFLRKFQPSPFIVVPFVLCIKSQQLTAPLNKKIIDWILPRISSSILQIFLVWSLVGQAALFAVR